MEVKNKKIKQGMMVRVDDNSGRTFIGFAYEPTLLHKILRIPFSEGYAIGITPIKLETLDLSLNPLKIIDTLKNLAFKIVGDPMVFKEHEVKNVFILVVGDEAVEEAEVVVDTEDIDEEDEAVLESVDSE